MCKLSYTAYPSCSCQYFHQEPEYCDYVKRSHRDFQGGAPEWIPQVLIHDATETLDHRAGNEILFQTKDNFDPIRRNNCQQIEYFRKDIEQQCPWHDAERTSKLRAKMEERAKEAMKREEKKKKDARLHKTKRILGAIFFPVNTH